MSLFTITPELHTTGTRVEEGQGEHARRFRAARRLDWRFLLPTPHLGRVGYWGPQNDPLWEALVAWCGTEAVLLEGMELPQGGPTFDALVVRLRPPLHLPALLAHVRPGGTLYGEWYGRWLPPRVRVEVEGHPVPPASPQAIKNILAMCPATQVHFYWHWPSFSACRRILPMTGPAREALAINGLGGWREVGVRWLRRWQLLDHLVPCFSSVIVREGAP